MNSRNSEQSNLINISDDLLPTMKLEAEDSLLSFPFDHIYACQSESGPGGSAPPAGKEVVVTCVAAEQERAASPDLVKLAGALAAASPDLAQLAAALTATQTQNEALAEIVIRQLDFIQRQSEDNVRKEKLCQSLKLENETLKSRLDRIDRRVKNQKLLTPMPPLTSFASVSRATTDPASAPSRITLDGLTELLIPEPFCQDPFDLLRGCETADSQPVAASCTVTSSTQSPNTVERRATYNNNTINSDTYSITANSADTATYKMQRKKRRPAAITSCMKVQKASTTESPPESASHQQPYEPVNKKAKMATHTYPPRHSQNNGNQKKPIRFRAGSLSERLQLIDTTPTGEDPYQLGEADMREQSPIPKLMLQKNKCRTNVTSARLYDVTPPAAPDADITTVQLNRYNLTNTYMHPSEIKDEEADSPPRESDLFDTSMSLFDMDLVKTEAELDWHQYDCATSTQQAAPPPPPPVTSLRDFSYGENSNNWAALNYEGLFNTPRSQPEAEQAAAGQSTAAPKSTPDKSARRVGRTTGLVLANNLKNPANAPEKGVRKRAMSTTNVLKNIKQKLEKSMRTPPLKPSGARPAPAAAAPAPAPAPVAPDAPVTTPINKDKFFGTHYIDSIAQLPTGVAPKPKMVKVKAAQRRSPVPCMTTSEPYETQIGLADHTWYLGLDTDLKWEDLDQPARADDACSVEVPNWRESLVTSSTEPSLGEDVDDRAFERRHHKLEAEERRQLRWHMRRVREQRHVARLRQRQRDPWYSSASATPTTYTVWPRPHADLQYIEITDTLPVTAFGEELPALPTNIFVLPWVRNSKPLKKIKRSKTLM